MTLLLPAACSLCGRSLGPRSSLLLLGMHAFGLVRQHRQPFPLDTQLHATQAPLQPFLTFKQERQRGKIKDREQQFRQGSYKTKVNRIAVGLAVAAPMPRD